MDLYDVLEIYELEMLRGIYCRPLLLQLYFYQESCFKDTSFPFSSVIGQDYLRGPRQSLQLKLLEFVGLLGSSFYIVSKSGEGRQLR